MPKLYSSKEIIKILKNNGFVFISQKGSHLKYKRLGNKTRTAIVSANKREIPTGTLHSILRQAGLKQEELED